MNLNLNLIKLKAMYTNIISQSLKRMCRSLLLFILVVILTVSCDKEVGPPVVTSVRLTDPATAGQNLIGASLDSWIVIQGENFINRRYFCGSLRGHLLYVYGGLAECFYVCEICDAAKSDRCLNRHCHGVD